MINRGHTSHVILCNQFRALGLILLDQQHVQTAREPYDFNMGVHS